MMKLQEEGRLDDWIEANLKWLYDTFGKENVVSCVLHMDEKTPHLHVTIVPIVNTPRQRREREGEKKNKVKQDNRLSADEVMSRAKLRSYQTTYAEAMNPFGLERGIVGSKAHYKTAMEHMRDEEVDLQTNIERLLDEMVKLQEQSTKLQGVVESQKKEQEKTKAGFAAKVMNAFGAGDLAKANETIKAKDEEIATLKKKCNTYAKKYNTDKAEWDKAKGELEKELQETKNSLQTYIGKNIDLANDLRMATGRQSFIANQSVSLLNELTGLSADSIAKVRQVAFALILGNGPVYVPCSGGGSVSSHDGWRGKDKDEDDYLFRLRCWLHAGKVVKSAYAPRKTFKRSR